METKELYRAYFQHRHDLVYLNIASQSKIFLKRHMTNFVPKENNLSISASSCTRFSFSQVLMFLSLSTSILRYDAAIISSISNFSIVVILM